MEDHVRQMARERLDLMERMQGIRDRLKRTLEAGCSVKDWGLAARLNLARALWSK